MTTILQQSSVNADHDYLLLSPNGLYQLGQPLGALCPHGLAQRQGHSLQQRFHFDAVFLITLLSETVRNHSVLSFSRTCPRMARCRHINGLKQHACGTGLEGSNACEICFAFSPCTNLRKGLGQMGTSAFLSLGLHAELFQFPCLGRLWAISFKELHRV